MILYTCVIPVFFSQSHHLPTDMRFPLDGGVELYFTHSQDERPRTVSNVSCDKSPCAIASWNSYENVSFTYEQIEEQGKCRIHVLYLLLYYFIINSWFREIFVTVHLGTIHMVRAREIGS